MTNRKYEVRGIDELEDVHAFRTDDRERDTVRRTEGVDIFQLVNASYLIFPVRHRR